MRLAKWKLVERRGSGEMNPIPRERFGKWTSGG
jgi:hypothetical protein